MTAGQHDASPAQRANPVASPPPARPSLVHRRIPIGATATVAALLLIAFAAGLFAFHPRGGGNTTGRGGQHATQIPTQAPVEGAVDVEYKASDALSPTDVWAVGTGLKNRSSTKQSSVISHFDGKRWHIDENAVFAGSQLSAISMGSASDGWAVGYHDVDTSGAFEPFLVHYTQGRWVAQTLNLPNVTLTQVQMFGPDAGWATGRDSTQAPIFLHFQHGVWTPTTFAPTHAALTQAAAMHIAAAPLAYYAPRLPLAGRPSLAVVQAQFLSDTEGWATGIDQTGIAVWQFHNGQWQTALHLATPPGADFLGLGANANTDVWVLGTAGVGQAFSQAKLAFHPLSTLSSGASVLLHFDGHTWTSMPVDSSASPPFLAGATWLTRYGVVSQQRLVLGLLMNQGGHWSATTFPQPVNSILSVSKTADGSTLVVAATDGVSDPQTLQLLRYANGTWSSV